MKKKTLCLVIIFILLSVVGIAVGAEARDLTSLCTFDSNGKSKNPAEMLDNDVSTYFPLKEKKAILAISCPEPIGGVYIMAFDKYGKDHNYDLQIPDGEDWKTIDQGGQYLVHYHELPDPATELRLVMTGQERLRIAEIRVFGPGEPPPEVQRWQTLEKCDIMLLSAHPDDEILWFAGLMPTYGGDRGYRIQVAVLAPTGGMRKLELLGAIWHCGVKYYPEMLGFIDKNGKNPEKQYSLWKGKNRVLSRVTEVVRKHQPEVIVTHGEKGEYGHGAHKTAADAAKNVVKLSGNAKKYPDSAKKYGTWEVKKLYLHEYEKNPILLNWNEPLAAFDGKTGYEVATEAFEFHASQIKRDWHFEVHGNHDNAEFGLYYTTVGQDTGIGDLMENITIIKE
ncbi:MAG: PIG-L family deacetylase [Clostridia bacterium]|nr:PIG-L family deacetylase [Clostridia bacterium]